MHPSTTRRALPSPVHTTVLVLVSLLLLLTSCTTPVQAFRFALVPGKVKCFTSIIEEPGRYEVRYRMVRSLSPFVSVSVSSPGGRILLEHEVARPDAKEIITVKRIGPLGICFNTAANAAVAAVSLNVTLDVIDADDAELTRMKKQAYTTSSPIALGVGKSKGSYRQMQYIFDILVKMHYAYGEMLMADTDMRMSFKETQALSWKLLYIYCVSSLVIIVIFFLRLRCAYERIRRRAKQKAEQVKRL